MSRVYEALRVKQQEAGDPHAGPAAVGTEDADPASLHTDLGTAEEILAAMGTGEEPRVPTDFAPPINAPSSVPPAGRTASPNGFQRLKLVYREASRLVFQTDPDGLAAEQFRFLRRTLEHKFPNGAVLLITSPAPKDGKTFTALNLSTCLAESGRSTLMLEADIRQPAARRVLGIKQAGSGIEETLAGTSAPDKVVYFVEALSLHLAMVAEPPADPSRLIGGEGMRKLLAWARTHFCWVVIDSPPVLPAADVAELIPLANAVLLVVRAESTPRDLATRAFELLGSHLSGVILNEGTIQSNPYYRYLADYRQKKSPLRRAESASEDERSAG